jgi:peptidoglycan/xylan/chitin deacetylase (PgdA/CDA1 family)
LPYIFDPNFDRFWIGPDGEKILISREGRNLNLFYLRNNDFASTGETLSLPYLYLPRNTRVRTVLWSEEDLITVLAGSIVHGESDTAVYRLDVSEPAGASAFTRTDDEGVKSLVLSPDDARTLVLYADKAEIRDYAKWSVETTVDHPQPLHGLWFDSTQFLLVGRSYMELLSVDGEGSTLLSLSQVDRYGYGPEAATPQVESGGYTLMRDESGWSEIEELNLRAPSVAGGDYRVYLENLSSGWYRNMIMVRNVDSVGTSPLFPRPRRQYEPFPNEDEPIDLTNFTHGSRIRRREVSLVFNAVDSVAGLTQILNTLAQYEVTATFFLNGEFIRRHPGAVMEIAESGHEVGSLFYAYFDMSNARFRVTSEFIKQGLARNEDEYFDATGKELSLLWHAPYYFTSPEIIAASREMNYAYVGRDVDSLDWVPKRDENGLSRLYYSSADIIGRVVEAKKPGSIIAMTVGRPGDDRPDGGRDDYLFQRLDVLMNSLIERGYQMVPVSTLMDHAQ